MANPELGAKQICPTCASKFYDLNRRPAHCPKCGSDFDPEEALKSRVRTRSRGPVPDYEEADTAPVKSRDDEEAEELEEADETPEIDQAVEADPVESDDDDGDPEAAPAPADDIGVDFEEDPELAEADDDEDVPFIEDDEDSDGFPDEDLGLPEEGGEEER